MKATSQEFWPGVTVLTSTSKLKSVRALFKRDKPELPVYSPDCIAQLPDWGVHWPELESKVSVKETDLPVISAFL